MNNEEIDQIEADASYWRTLAILLGWTLIGFTGRDHASFATRGQSIQLTGSQRDDIVVAITTASR